jgi:hypothetical protein
MIAHTVSGQTPFRLAHLAARRYMVASTRLIKRHRQLDHSLIKVAFPRRRVAPGDLPFLMGLKKAPFAEKFDTGLPGTMRNILLLR